MSVKKIFSLIFYLFSLFCSSFVFAQDKKINLMEESSKRGMTLYWDSFAENGLIEKNGHYISFHIGDNFILSDYQLIVAADAPVLENGKIYVSPQFIDSAELHLAQEAADNLYRIGAILIDPGHGGKDPGSIGGYTQNGKKITLNEKDVNLRISKMLYEKLKAAYPDKQILMTRDKDVFLTLEQRTKIANGVKLKDKEAIIYCSIHQNSNLSSKPSGYEVWYLSPGYRRQVLKDSGDDDASLLPILNSMLEEEYTTESILIAKFIMDGIGAQVGNLSQARGIKAEEWYVVKNSFMPSVLVEAGFISNPQEAKLLNDENYLQKMSTGIYNGLQAFVTHFERSKGFTGINH